MALALAVALAIASAPVRAGTDWLCGLSDDLVRLVCVADLAVEPMDGGAPTSPTARVNGTVFPLDVRGVWTVDLWSPPSDPEMVETLARATICYRSPGCTVVLTLSGAIEGGDGLSAQSRARAGHAPGPRLNVPGSGADDGPRQAIAIAPPRVPAR